MASWYLGSASVGSGVDSNLYHLQLMLPSTFSVGFFELCFSSNLPLLVVPAFLLTHVQ